MAVFHTTLLLLAASSLVVSRANRLPKLELKFKLLLKVLDILEMEDRALDRREEAAVVDPSVKETSGQLVLQAALMDSEDWIHKTFKKL